MLPEGRFSPFPLVPEGSRVDGFSFKREFGRSAGKGLSKDLYDMLESPTGDIDLSFSLPIKLFLFPKHKFKGEQVNRSKEILTESLNNQIGNVLLYSRPDVRDLGVDLAFYTAVFGEFPIGERTKKEVLRVFKEDIEEVFETESKEKEKNLFPAALLVSNYLVLGGPKFWTAQQLSDMLEDLKDRLFDEWHDYQSTHRFNSEFAIYAMAYKVLRNSTL